MPLPKLIPFAAIRGAETKIPSGVTRALSTNWLRALLLFLIAAAVRTPSLGGDFVWDDDFLARDSPFIKSPLLIFEVFRHYLFPDSFSGHYRPVQNLSFLVDYYFWNTNTFGFHLTNLVLHAASAVVLFFLLQCLLRPLHRPEWFAGNSGFVSALAFFVALLWAVHPVHSAAIDYISGRADSLAFLFAAGGWLLVLRTSEAPGGVQRYLLYASAALLGLLALCSRETACLWFVLFLLHTLVFSSSPDRRRQALTVAACLGLFAIYYGLRQLPPPRPGPGPSQGWGAPVRAVLALRALGDYGRLMVFPGNLHMERTVVNPENYSNTATWQQSIGSEYLSIGGLFLIALLAAGCRWRGNGQTLRIFGTAWFVIGYLPISNLVELNATCAEHWLYLPSVGLLIFLAGVTLDLPAHYRPALAAFASLAVVALGVRSAVRSGDWASAETFYERTVAAGGDSMRVSTNLAEIYAGRRDFAKAEKILRHLLGVIPDFPMARNGLARVLLEQGKKKEAEALFAGSAKKTPETKKYYPRTWIAVVNLARLLHLENRDKEALAALDKARRDYPEAWEVVSLQSELLRQIRQTNSAFPLVANFAQSHWWHYGAALALGRLYAQDGDAEHAVEALRHASRLDVHEVDALNLIAQMRLRQNRLSDAYEVQKTAVARQPDAPSQYLLLSDILTKMGQLEEARDAMAQSARLKAVGLEAGTLPN